MGRQVEKLSALIVSRAKARGYLGDGGGLYLQVSASGSKSWVFRFKDHGRLREMGLGSVHAIGLAEARKRATACRQMRLDGTDPIAVKKAGKLKAKLEAARAMTFRQCAEVFDPQDLCLPGFRCPAGPGGRCRPDRKGAGADLEGQDGNRFAATGAH